MGDFGPRMEFLFRVFQIEKAAVIGEELNAKPTKDGFEVGRRELKLAGTHHASARCREAVKIVSSPRDDLTSAHHTADARKSTEIAHD